jgi:hypothetical protein
MLREGKGESAIERELGILYEHQRVPREFSPVGERMKE